MIDVDNQPDLDEVLNLLSENVSGKPTNRNSSSTTSTEEHLTDDEMYHFLMNKLRDTIESNTDVIEQTKDLVTQLGTSEYIEAHASLVKSQADLMKNMVGIIMEKKKLAQAKELKTRDLDIKEKSAGAKKKAELTEGATQQTNILIASRDSIFDALFGTGEDKEKAEIKIKEANGMIVDV